MVVSPGARARSSLLAALIIIIISFIYEKILIIILNLHDSSLGLAVTPDPRALDVSLATRSCHKNMIIK